MNRNNRTLITIGIMCLALTDSGGGATAPALQAIAVAFPKVPPVAIQMVSTVPQLLLALMPLLYAKLLDYGVRKRVLVVIGSICFTFGGILPFFMHGSIYTLLLARAIFGIGNGLCMPLSVDLVVDFFEGHQRNKMQGFVQFMMGVSGILFALMGGFLCGINWTYTFLAYGVSAVFLLVAIILIPEPDRQGKIAAQEGITTVKSRAKVSGGVYLIAILFGLYFMFWMTLPTNGAFVAIGENIASTTLFGVLTCAMPICNAIFGFTFGFYFKKIKFATFPISCLFCAAGLYIMSNANSVPMVALSFGLLGASSGIMQPTIITKVTGMVPYSAGAASISCQYFFMGILQFMQPITFGLFGSSSTGRPALLIASIGAVVVGILMVIANSKTPAYQEQTDAAA